MTGSAAGDQGHPGGGTDDRSSRWFGRRGSMLGLAARMRRVGRMAETAPPRPADSPVRSTAPGSVQLRHVDAGSCNGCEIEISGCFSPVYDAERYGVRLGASPRHADGLLVTGVVTRNMASALRDTFDAVAAPKTVIAVGDCACDGGMFTGAYAAVGPVSAVVPVDVEVRGCPPSPSEIIAGLRSVSRR